MIRAIKLVLYYFVYQIAATFIAIAGYYGWYYLVHKTIDIQGGLPLMVSLSANFFAIIVMGWQLIVNKYVIINKKTLSLGKPKIVFQYLVLGLTAFLWMNYLSDIINLPNWFEDLFIDMKSNLFGIITICIAAPIFEEMLFRGAIEGYLLTKWKNPAKAIFISALLFGLIHGNPAQLLFAFCFGLVLGLVYYRTKSLGACMLLHLINNGIATTLMILYPENNNIASFFDKSTMLIIAITSLIIFLIFLRLFTNTKNKALDTL